MKLDRYPPALRDKKRAPLSYTAELAKELGVPAQALAIALKIPGAPVGISGKKLGHSSPAHKRVWYPRDAVLAWWKARSAQ